MHPRYSRIRQAFDNIPALWTVLLLSDEINSRTLLFFAAPVFFFYYLFLINRGYTRFSIGHAKTCAVTDNRFRSRTLQVSSANISFLDLLNCIIFSLSLSFSLFFLLFCHSTDIYKKRHKNRNTLGFRGKCLFSFTVRLTYNLFSLVLCEIL